MSIPEDAVGARSPGRCTLPLVAMGAAKASQLPLVLDLILIVPPKFMFFLEPQNVSTFGNVEGLFRCNLLS